MTKNIPTQNNPEFHKTFGIVPGKTEILPVVSLDEMHAALDKAGPETQENETFARKSKFGRNLLVASGVTVGAVVAGGLAFGNQATNSVEADTYVPTQEQQDSAVKGLEAVEPLPENPENLVIEVPSPEQR